MGVKNIRIEDYDYPLPDERIALHPLGRRDACKLLVANQSGKINHQSFSRLPLFLKPDTLIVANETRVIRARMEFEKSSGARIEIFLLEPIEPSDYQLSFASSNGVVWSCLIGNSKRWKEGPLQKRLSIDGRDVKLEVFRGDALPDGSVQVEFRWDNPSLSFAEIVEAAGRIPIPPYLKRESEESDTDDYQTVYSHTDGSVAAPTAGLHFTPQLLQELRHRGHEFATVTLHVGAGTFKPVKSEEIGDHPMHAEWFSISRQTLQRLLGALENGRDVMAVGTTTVRTLESLPYIGAMMEEADLKGDDWRVTQWMPYGERFNIIDTIRALKTILRYLSANDFDRLETTTSIMIAPGFRWRIVNRLITNFHQPKSTLLLLVSSFLGTDCDGRERWREIYDEALSSGYRFLSYGDACLFSRGPQPVELPLAKSMVLRAATIDAAQHPERLAALQRECLCDDAEYYIKALRDVLESGDKELETEVYIGEGAAPLRFLTAFAASWPGAKVKITCAEGLRKRPIQPLIDTLLGMGADIRFNNDPADWHIAIRGQRLHGGDVETDSSFTSQYLSALLLASPLWERAPETLKGRDTVSRPYLDMTVKMMEHPDHAPEPDWSGAAFFYEYAFVTGKDVAMRRLTPPAKSLQGDASVCDLFSALGVNTRFCKDGGAVISVEKERYSIDGGVFEFDFTDFPDMVPSVAVALCYRRIPFLFHGVGHLRFKECDRLAALQSLLTRIGYEVTADADALRFSGDFKPLAEFPVEIDPYGDHRMAMAFYPLELIGMVNIEDKGVVSKSFPNFYQQF